MRIVDKIIMKADADHVYHIAANVEQWPEYFPLYRWVEVQERSPTGAIVEIAARRGWIPVKWTAVQLCDEENREVFFRHIEGATRGMAVIWRIIPTDDGVCLEVIHELTMQRRIIGSPIGRFLIGWGFVKNITRRTLQQMKSVAESNQK
ncbi:MAG TPA: SRPBCC family protein [Armatimonadota bacterium]|nr:SRPBCC family protein [Armatimonadota bacterium]